MPTATEQLADFHATWPKPEAFEAPAYLALKAAADFEAQVALHSDPLAMSAKADSLDADAIWHDGQALSYERGAGARLENGNDHAAREWADMAVAQVNRANTCRREANVLRAAAARLIERVAA